MPPHAMRVGFLRSTTFRQAPCNNKDLHKQQNSCIKSANNNAVAQGAIPVATKFSRLSRLVANHLLHPNIRPKASSMEAKMLTVREWWDAQIVHAPTTPEYALARIVLGFMEEGASLKIAGWFPNGPASTLPNGCLALSRKGFIFTIDCEDNVGKRVLSDDLGFWIATLCAADEVPSFPLLHQLIGSSLEAHIRSGVMRNRSARGEGESLPDSTLS